MGHTTDHPSYSKGSTIENFLCPHHEIFAWDGGVEYSLNAVQATKTELRPINTVSAFTAISADNLFWLERNHLLGDGVQEKQCASFVGMFDIAGVKSRVPQEKMVIQLCGPFMPSEECIHCGVWRGGGWNHCKYRGFSESN